MSLQSKTVHNEIFLSAEYVLPNMSSFFCDQTRSATTLLTDSIKQGLSLQVERHLYSWDITHSLRDLKFHS